MIFKTLVRKYKKGVFAKPTGNYFEETDVPVLFPLTMKFNPKFVVSLTLFLDDLYYYKFHRNNYT